MSTFYFNVKSISRGKNQSAVASASYRSGEKLYSELDEETKEYRARTVQPECFIIAPDNAPEWVYNRERLWNEVEWVESNANSRLAREVKVALPIEISEEQQRLLLETYVKDNFVDDGMVADVSIHRDVEHNPHAHIMLTIRPFDEHGEWIKQKSKKEYLKDEKGNFIYNDKGNKKTRKIDLIGWDKKENLLSWRKNYADIVNDFYKANNIKESVSHKSYEEQGIDKIPKHRLSREEYQFEKRMKEESLKNGVEYEPTTTYAKLNDEIEKDNKRIELLNNKVVDLNEYKSTVQSDLMDQLKELRNKQSLTKSEWLSIKVVSKAVKGYVDIDNASKNVKRMGNWKSKLDRDKERIIAFGKTLEKAKRVYNDKPKDVMMYGFVPNNFLKEFEVKNNEYKNMINDYSTKVKAYQELNTHSERAYDIQKMFTNEEFSFIYPQYQDVLEGNDKATELQNKYVKLFENNGLLYDSIPELETNINKFSNKYVASQELVNEWKELKNSLVILQRTKSKHEKDYKEQFRNWESESVFNKSLKYTQTNEQISNKEIQKDELISMMNSQLKSIYPEMDNNILASLPDESKSRLLELYVEEENTGSLSNDLQILDKEIKSDIRNGDSTNNQNDFERNDFNTNNDSVAGSTGDLFSTLINNAQQNEGKDDLEKKRQKDKMQSKVRKIRNKHNELEL